MERKNGQEVWSESEVTAKVDALIEAYSLPADKKLRSELLKLPRIYYAPRRPVRDTFAAAYNEWLGPLLQTGAVLTAIGLVIWCGFAGVSRVASDGSRIERYTMQTGYVYQTLDLMETADRQPVQVLVQTRLKGRNIPTLSLWREDPQYREQKAVLGDRIWQRTLEGVERTPNKVLETMLMQQFSRKPEYFTEGSRWTASVAVRISRVVPEEEKDDAPK